MASGLLIDLFWQGTLSFEVEAESKGLSFGLELNATPSEAYRGGLDDVEGVDMDDLKFGRKVVGRW